MRLVVKRGIQPADPTIAYRPIDAGNAAMDLGAFATRLKALRAAAKKTQFEVATEIGVKELTISRYERGAQEPQAEILARLAALFGTTVDYLIHGEPPNAPAEAAQEPEAFAEFLTRYGPTLQPPLTHTERCTLAGIRFHRTSPEKYLGVLMLIREGMTEEERVASEAATKAAEERGRALGVKPRGTK